MVGMFALRWVSFPFGVHLDIGEVVIHGADGVQII